MATTIVELSGDEAKLLRSFQRLVEKEAEIAAGLKGIGQEGEKAGDKVGDGLEGAANKASKEFDQVVRDLRKMGPEGRKVASEVESHLRDTGKGGRESMDSVIERLRAMDPEAAEAAAAMRQHISDQAEIVEAKLLKLPTPFEKIKRSAREAFGASGLASLSTYAAGLGGITAAISTISAGFDMMKQKQEAALASLQAQADPEKRLAQIATSGEDLDQMIAEADLLSLQYGMDRNQSRSLMFSARSEGFSEDVDQIARFGQVVDVESQGALAGSLGRLFESEGLDVEQRLSGVLAAASTSAFDFETVGASVKKSAAASRQQGADMAETLAANATLANMIGDTAGDRVQALADEMQKSDALKGQGFVGGLQTLMAMPEDEREDLLGEGQEVNEAYNLLSEQLPQLIEMTTAVRSDIAATTAGRGMLRHRTETVENSDRFQQRMAVRRSEIAKELAEEERYSGDAAAITAAQNSLDADLTERGTGLFGVGTNQALVGRSLSDLPLVGSFLPDLSLAEGTMQVGNAVGIAPEASGRALAATVAHNDLGANGVVRTLAEQTDRTGVTTAIGNLYDQLSGQQDVMERLESNLREQTEIQRQSLAATQETADNTRPSKPAPNYSAGQSAAAAEAAMP